MIGLLPINMQLLTASLVQRIIHQTIEAIVNKSITSSARLAASITRAASWQTFFTICFLVDRGMVNDAFRAYAYFRWVDDWLDQEDRPLNERLDFVKRQQALIESCYLRERQDLAGLTPEERLLADLVQTDHQKDSGLQAYIRNMMAIMAFDAERRGYGVSQREIYNYTHWLAVAVTEALHYFIGNGCGSPCGDLRYMAVTGAHITHMLRDALEDVEAGYYNIPSECLDLSGGNPQLIQSQVYRDWVRKSVQQARACFQAGREYLSQVENFRCRLAGYAYIYRFESVLDCIEREQFSLRKQYSERKSLRGMLEMTGWALWMAFRYRRPSPSASILHTR